MAALARSEPVLRLKSRAGDPSRFQMAELAPLKRRDPSRRRLIARFPEAPRPEQIEAMRSRGVRLLQYVPDEALLVSTPDDLSWDGLGVLQVASLLVEDKISPLLDARTGEEAGKLFVIEFHPDVEPAEARAIALQENLALRDHPELVAGHLLVEGAMEQVRRLAEWDEVAYIFPASADLAQGLPVHACAGAVTDQGGVGQYVVRVGEGWDGAGKNAVQLTYTFQSLTTRLGADDVRGEFQRALAEWARHVKIGFSQGARADAARNLNLLFASGGHGDAYPFDGRGKVLAHTFYPAPPNPEPIAGDLHLDDDEDWKIGADMDVYSVVLHELGHALGLGHSDKPGAVMYPYYRRMSELTQEDIGAIQDMYAAQDGSPAGPQPLQLEIKDPPATPFSTTASSLTVSGTAAGGNGAIQVSWASDRGPSGAAEGSLTWRATVALSAGANRITVTATDAQRVQVSRSITVLRQESGAASPVVRITSPASDGVYQTRSNTVTLAGVASHTAGIARVGWANGSGDAGTAQGTASWTTGPIRLAAGPNQLTVTAWDNSGGFASQSLQVNYEPVAASDSTAPSISIISPAGTNVLTSASSIVFRGTAGDDVGVTEVRWSSNTSGAGLATGAANWVTPEIPLLVGFNTITIRASDAAGNSGWRSVVVTRW